MNTEYFIARRFAIDKEGKKLISRSIVRLSVFSISLSVAVMIIALAVVTGFKKEIRRKVIGFGSHIQILNFDSNNSFESIPIQSDQDFLPALRETPGVRHVQVFATKPGIIKAGRENQGAVAKGVGPDFDWTFFRESLVDGRVFQVSDTASTSAVLMSLKLANMLGLKTGDEFPMFFFDERPHPRRFKLCGLFQTSLEEFDKQFILTDIKNIQKLYGWEENEITGFEILIDDYDRLDQVTGQVQDLAGFQLMEDGSKLKIISVKEKYPQIFHWLNLLDMNVIVILLLMAVVAVVNMISGLMIIILDRTHSIGLLKALGSSNQSVKKIFLYQSFLLIIRGLVLGNVLALILCFLQDEFRIIRLNQASYFIDYVPVNLSVSLVLLTNLGSLLFIFLSMYLPVLLVTKIDPVKTIRYD